jgi:myo-inositol-1-phosphate synthase
MQIKVNFLCRDSILAAPDCAGPGAVPRSGQAHAFAALHRHSGVVELLSEVAADAEGLYPEHDLFIQSMKLKNTLRHIMGETLITHLGLEYYD